MRKLKRRVVLRGDKMLKVTEPTVWNLGPETSDPGVCNHYFTWPWEEHVQWEILKHD